MKIVLLITALVLVADQVTKQLITRTMEIGESRAVINNFLYITYHRNSGAAFGILQGQMLIFYIITAITVIGIIIWLSKINLKKQRLLAIALSLILGGALGNFIDRVVYQSVIDFVHTVWWGNHFPIFNIADTALVSGAILMLFSELKQSKDLYFETNNK